MNKPLLIILATVTLDAIGIGLIMPILPDLLRSLEHSGDISMTYGALIALYALMQFLCAPVIGLLSDRLGRRPVLITSMLGASVDYLLMALAPQLWMLFLGRAIAGITAANISVATAYITDITPPADRARRFGYFHAMFGIGFIIGPAAGGVLGDYWLRAPFLLAAALNLMNALLALQFLPETRPASLREAERGQPVSLNPFLPLGWALRMPALLPMIALIMVFYLVAQVYGSVWVIYGEDMFAWTSTTVGLSLGLYGAVHAVVQMFVTGPVVARVGEKRAVLFAFLVEVPCLLLLSATGQGWVIFALCAPLALAGIGLPALQSLLSAQVSEKRQGELQGVISGLGSLTAAIGPLLFTGIYTLTKLDWPGAVWAVAAAINVAAVPVMLRIGQPDRAARSR